MPLVHRFTVPLPHGLHARPASHLEALAATFESAIRIVNERTGTVADARSVLAVLTCDIRYQDVCRIEIEGPDETAALAALATFVEQELPRCDDEAPEEEALAPLPHALRELGVGEAIRGIPAAPGFGEGRILRLAAAALAEDFVRPSAGAATDEITRFHSAVEAVAEELRVEMLGAQGVESELLGAHASLLRDPTLQARVEELCRLDALEAGAAVERVGEQFFAALQASDNRYMQERTLDVQDVVSRLLSALYGQDAFAESPALSENAIVVAESLTPGRFLGLDRSHLRGLVLSHAGATSHTVILARSFGIPTVAGAAAASVLSVGQTVLLDATRGIVLPDPPEGVRRYYRIEEQRQQAEANRREAYRAQSGSTKDGAGVAILANVASAEEVAHAVSEGAQGVGLFRTEMVFLDRPAAPTEDEQFEIYRTALAAAAGRPVVFRTFDIGGDKPAPYLDLPSEPNPFLGRRGVRLYPELDALIRAQVRALLRAAAHGDVRIMVPMITGVEEMRAFRALVQDEAGEGTLPPLGAMIEVPSAVFAIPELAAEADFFSLGTNDLLQYFLAADRDNARVRGLYSWTHPPFIRLIRLAGELARESGRPLGICGEAGDLPFAPAVLAGFGLSSLSMGAGRIASSKESLAGRTLAQCEALAATASEANDRADVIRRLHAAWLEMDALPLIAEDVIAIDVEATSKVEAIKQLCDRIALAGRATDSASLEEAVWQREITYSTGFGHGFAMPHCKSEHVLANTVAVARLREPVEWGSLDGQPVRLVVLLAMGASGQEKEHMRIFARLSRLVMREEFREALESAPTPRAILDQLEAALAPGSP